MKLSCKLQQPSVECGNNNNAQLQATFQLAVLEVQIQILDVNIHLLN